MFFLLDVQQRQATAESNIHRSIADYNLAIMNYHFATGNLLSRFNIELTEGPWSEYAQGRASVKAGRIQEAKRCCNDTAPLSAGTFRQQAADVSYIPTDGGGYNQGTVFTQPAESNSNDQSEPVEVEDSLLDGDDVDLDPLEDLDNLDLDSSDSTTSNPIVDPKAKGFLSGVVDRLKPRSRR